MVDTRPRGVTSRGIHRLDVLAHTVSGPGSGVPTPAQARRFPQVEHAVDLADNALSRTIPTVNSAFEGGITVRNDWRIALCHRLRLQRA
jgi:hypothetical protein